MTGTANTDQDLWVSWDEYHQLIERLVCQVHQSGWQMDQILCLARGGLRVGDILSRVFDRPLAILSTSSYREEGGTRQGSLVISPTISLTVGALQGRVLVVDDLADSGATLTAVIDHLKTHFPVVTDIRTGVLWSKACSRFRPDYCAQALSASPWIHQPFERYDTLTPQDLALSQRNEQ